MAPELRRLLDAGAADEPSRWVLADARSTRVVDRRALATAAASWTAALDAWGIPAGARVLVDVADPLLFAVAHLSVIAAGRCSAPVDPNAPAAEAERTRRALSAALAVTDRAGRPGLRLDRATGAPPPPMGPGEPAARLDAGRSGGVVLLTSGSTGSPKAVELAEAQLLHVARAVADHHRLTPADRGYCPLPLFHVNAQVVGLLATLVSGGQLVLDRRFRRTGFWDLLIEREITWVNAVPAILTILAHDPTPVLPGPELRFVRSASAPLPGPVRDLFAARTGLPVVESYGMTEAASQITATPLGAPHRPGSAGRPVAVELRIAGDDGRPLPVGAVGRVRIRGAGVISGYAGGAAADRFDADGWLDTADLGRVDEDGWLYLVGRADDVVNRGGELVHPREVEEVLLADADVADAVVVGRPDDVLGAVPVACVRPVDGAGPGVAERLAERCARELAAFKRPAEIRLVDGFPVGPTGKVRRAAVRDGLAAETVAPAWA
jgi:acyl-CoA synthetase (AMP-forming)/AMP-acid ligase II